MKISLDGLKLTLEFKDIKQIDSSIAVKIATSPEAPAEVLHHLCKFKNYEVRSWVASNKNTSSKTLSLMVRDTSENVLKEVAKNPNTLAADLIKLSDHSKKDVRYRVLSNPNCPIEVLHKYKDDYAAKGYLALNPKLPEEFFDDLFNFSILNNPNSRWGYNKCQVDTCANPSAPPHLLLQKFKEAFLVYKQDSQHYLSRGILFALASNVSSPKEIFGEIIDYNDQTMVKAVMDNPSCPPIYKIMK
jgi:hypothetical protein